MGLSPHQAQSLTIFSLKPLVAGFPGASLFASGGSEDRPYPFGQERKLSCCPSLYSYRDYIRDTPEIDSTFFIQSLLDISHCGIVWINGVDAFSH